MRKQTGWVSALLTIGALGYVIGVLTAPRSGRETRKYLKDKSELLRDRSRLKLQTAKVNFHAKKVGVQQSLTSRVARMAGRVILGQGRTRDE